jgi:nitrogen regulatory protein PII-like uncharacterized protein
MITADQDITYLLSTPQNHTCTNLADHLDGVSHDVVSDFLRTTRITARDLWHLVHEVIADSADACLIVDDSVQEKRYSHFMGLVKRQYSGAVGGLVRGIGVVNLVHSSGLAGEFYPIDYRIYAPDQDGKTKNQHFQEMLLRAVSDKGIQATTVLFDSWYASVDNLKLIQRLHLRFFTTLKSNRMVSLSPETGYVHLDTLAWTDEQLQQGISVKLKELPFRVRLFKVVAPHGHSDWAITNDSDPTVTTQVVQQQSDVRWQVEELHRALKQLTGSERCQCRTARSQRTHLACCYRAWLSLKSVAKQTGQSLYKVHSSLFDDYLRAELRSPRIPVFQRG